MKRAWSLASVTLALSLVVVAEPAVAKRDGMNLACHNCHEGRDEPHIDVALSAPRVEPGQALTITVTAKHERAKVGGVFVNSNGLGSFDLIDTVGTRLFDNTVTQATHAMPHPYVNGQVQFSFRWTAPATPGAVRLDVWSNAANDNLKPDDDSAGEALVGVSVGCDGAWYYTDADKDGAGAEDDKTFSCTPLPDRIKVGGDCQDGNPQVGPAVPELCNNIDDDCDGVADDGFTPVLLVTDADGDGFGSLGGKSMIGCPPVAGFAPSFDDCNDSDPSVHPGALELANLRDDNCNSQVDEAMTPAPLPPQPPPAATPSAATPAADSSCAFAPTPKLRALPFLGGALLLGVSARRSVRRLRRPTASAEA